jgi:hypothetical protein
MTHIFRSWTVLLRIERLEPFSPAPCSGPHVFCVLSLPPLLLLLLLLLLLFSFSFSSFFFFPSSSYFIFFCC